jgi:predicted transcriptional regulator
MFREITEKRPHSRRTKRSHIIIAQEHLDAIVAMLARGNMTAGAITKEYGALAATSVLVALHNLEDAGRVVRVGSELRTGRPIVWGLAR